jgi:hypothetical protein
MSLAGGIRMAQLGGRTRIRGRGKNKGLFIMGFKGRAMRICPLGGMSLGRRGVGLGAGTTCLWDRSRSYTGALLLYGLPTGFLLPLFVFAAVLCSALACLVFCVAVVSDIPSASEPCGALLLASFLCSGSGPFFDEVEDPRGWKWYGRPWRVIVYVIFSTGVLTESGCV